MTRDVVTLPSQQKIVSIQEWLASGDKGTSHQGFPVVNNQGITIGVVTQRDLLMPDLSADQNIADIIRRTPLFVYDDCTVRQAVDHMVNHGVGRLPVIHRSHHSQLVGIVTRSDVLSVFNRRVNDAQLQQPIWRSGAQENK